MTVHLHTCTAFEGHRRIASGALPDVALAVREVLARGEQAPVLVFDDVTSRPVEFDLRGTPDEIVARFASQDDGGQTAHAADDADDATADTPRGRGRPKLGVVAREITLLPRHWDWLNGQSGGASVALRKLVDAARVAGENKDRQRAAQEAVYRFMTALAGNLPRYEDATRALYADDRPRFDEIVAAWPQDVRDYTLRLANTAFATHA